MLIHYSSESYKKQLKLSFKTKKYSYITTPIRQLDLLKIYIYSLLISIEFVQPQAKFYWEPEA